MAIFVSNPTSPAVSALSSDALDPSAAPPEEGFTEELAAAMQLPELATDTTSKNAASKLASAELKTSELQILPAEVLLNAVGDANFASTGQVLASDAAAALAETAAEWRDDTARSDDAPLAPESVNSMQGAELAAANLAAQMATPMVNLPLAGSTKDTAVSGAQAVTASMQSGQDAFQTSQAPDSGSGLQAGEQVASASTVTTGQAPRSSGTDNIGTVNLATTTAAQQAQGIQASDSQTSRLFSTAQAQAESNTASRAVVANKVNPNSVQEADAAGQVLSGTQTSAQAPLQLNTATTSNLRNANSELKAHTASDATLIHVSPSPSDESGAGTANPNNLSINLTNSAPASSVETSALTQTAAIAHQRKVNPAGNTPSEVQVAQGQESAFNFNANLAKSEPSLPKALEHPNSSLELTKANLPSQGDSPASSARLNVSATVDSISTPQPTRTGENTSAVASATEIEDGPTSFSQIQSNLKTSSKVDVLSANPSSAADSTVSTPTEMRATETRTYATSTPEAPKTELAHSLEDISSSFVSSLVGGPQRPVNTVMDWISTQSQERPAPVVPHEVRLDAGAVQLEIQKMVKQGGGHVVMELTPPDQSKFTIELKLDERGGALLIVEGVSDSTKTRLEQSAPQLREQFQQMGLALQLDMRQQGQSANSGSADFLGFQERSASANNWQNNAPSDASQVLTSREASALRARESGSNQVYLYA